MEKYLIGGLVFLGLGFLVYHFHTVIVAKIDTLLEKVGLIHTTVTATNATATSVAAVQAVQGTAAVAPVVASTVKVPVASNGMVATKNADGTVTWTTAVPDGAIQDKDGVILQPVTPDVLFATFQSACAAATLPAGTYTNAFGSWNQMEWLRRLDAKAFANWCAQALTVKGIGGGTSGYGWLTGLSVDGSGFFMALGAQTPSVVVPNTDPR